MKLFSLPLIFLILFSVEFASGTCSLPIPSSPKLKNETSCSVDVSWKKVTGASYYKVRYKVSSSGTWLYITNITGTSITLSGLEANTSYDAAVASFCSDNTTIGYSATLSKVTKKCSTPINVSSSSVTTTSALISWTPLCGSNNFIINYRIQGVSAWTTVSNITESSFPLTNLQPGTTYEYRVKADCGAVKSVASSILTFTTHHVNVPKHNILLFVLDDARYDEFGPNGAPSWFSTPGITSIAEEGVNFKLTIPTTSQCAPSRACIYTGVYPHINGCKKNGDTLDTSFPLIQQILKDNNYYTGFIGKYGQYLGKPRGFNWWATSLSDDYIDPEYEINGNDTTIPGHITDVYAQLAKTFLNSVPQGQNFVLYYFTRAPHFPATPRLQDSSLYLDETIPFPSNFSFYSNNYPSFYQDEKWNVSQSEAKAFKLARFQTLKGASDNMDSILTWIQQRDGTLDSTLILFTSDNGYLLGEHKMHEKILALEESFRVPLFMRYPKWFPSNTVINDEIASNVDVATTLLDYAGIPNTYSFQGLSLRQLANGETQRQIFLYETGGDADIAKLRAVRTLNDVFIRSYCKSTTEEYYDLITDPLNNTNQIFNSDYSAVISQRRTLLDSLRTAYNDITPTKKTCNLVTSGQRIEIYNGEETPELEMVIGPNPAAGTFTIYFTSHEKPAASISVCDELGHVLWQQQYKFPLDVLEEVDCSQWSNGFYFVKAEQNGKIYGRKILVQE